jgi:hypothetical protein
MSSFLLCTATVTAFVLISAALNHIGIAASIRLSQLPNGKSPSKSIKTLLIVWCCIIVALNYLFYLIARGNKWMYGVSLMIIVTVLLVVFLKNNFGDSVPTEEVSTPIPPSDGDTPIMKSIRFIQKKVTDSMKTEKEAFIEFYEKSKYETERDVAELVAQINELIIKDNEGDFKAKYDALVKQHLTKKTRKHVIGFASFSYLWISDALQRLLWICLLAACVFVYKWLNYNAYRLPLVFKNVQVSFLAAFLILFALSQIAMMITLHVTTQCPIEEDCPMDINGYLEEEHIGPAITPAILMSVGVMSLMFLIREHV